MMLIALFLTLTMAFVAGLHAYWARGGLWPAQSEQELTNMVVGDPRLTGMPPRSLTWLVAGVLAGIAAWPLILAPFLSMILPWGLLVAATFLLSAVFLARGIASYVSGVKRLNAVEPFRRLNRRYYGPFCILVGLGFLMLAFNGV